MKKIYFLFIGLILLLSIHKGYCQQSNKRKSDVADLGLKGKVKQLDEEKFNAELKSGEIIKSAKPITPSENNIKKFDSNGYIVESDAYIGDGKKMYRTTYTYDEKGYSKKDSTFYTDTLITQYHINKYDNEGSLIKSDYYNSDSILISGSSGKYDTDKNIIELIDYDGKPRVCWKINYTYSNKVLKTNYGQLYKKDGSVNESYLETYDNKGNKIEFKSYNAKGDMVDKLIYKYDDDGNVIESYNYNPKGVVMYKNRFTYDFDKQRNWIKRISFNNDIPKKITERKIKYY